MIPVTEESAETKEDSPEPEALLRILSVRDAVLFPHNMIPLTAGKEWTAHEVERAARAGTRFGVIAKRDAKSDASAPEDLFEVGTEAKVVKVIRFPDNSQGAIIQGTRRFRVKRYVKVKAGELLAEVEFSKDEPFHTERIELAALARTLKQLVQKAIQLSPNIPAEAGVFIENVQDPAYLSDLIIPHLSLDFETKQALLEVLDLETRLRRVHVFLAREIEILEMSQKINAEVRGEIQKQQRKYYVKEQLKLLQKELGDLDGKPAGGAGSGDPQDLRERVEKSGMPQDAKDAALREVDRMGMMQAGAPEYMVSHTYVNWLLDIPWGIHTQAEIDLKQARSVLDADHYGLPKVKRRILEFLAVIALKKQLKGPILVLVGPPGVGKTSLGKSVAKALGRKFVRIALGGVRDEAEMRGHRRTYVGSMPGKIAEALKRAGSMDPVILLDEVDKLSSDHRGDPASALLEVLDSEQNHAFVDHYLNVPLDLSKVLFFCTANTLSTIPGPLRDRMEVVELTGYTLHEKVRIAQDYLVPQVFEEHGVSGNVQIDLPEPVMRSLIQQYTREAGVRSLRREIASVARGLAREIVEAAANQGGGNRDEGRRALKEADLKTYLGPPAFLETKKPARLPVGVGTGLAYTPHGGDVLFIETATSEGGTGKLSVTGQLGEVMKESVQTAMAYIRSNAKVYGLEQKTLNSLDLHVHFPAGAVKKDGPSAGVAVFMAMLSQFSGKALSSDLAMTGEISLRGEVLPVGGIKEKLVAAHRYGIKRVLIPKENEKDLVDIPDEVLFDVDITPVETMGEAMAATFEHRAPQSKRRR